MPKTRNKPEAAIRAQGATAEGDGRAGKRLVSRTSVSLPEDLLTELDTVVGERGFANRSQAVAKLLHRSLVAHRHEVGDRVMVGTVTLFYDNKAVGLQQRLARLQQDNIAEVISSLHIHLDNNQTLEVVLVQGPARTLQRIADEMVTQKGILSGHLELVAALIPQVHPHRDEQPVVGSTEGRADAHKRKPRARSA